MQACYRERHETSQELETTNLAHGDILIYKTQTHASVATQKTINSTLFPPAYPHTLICVALPLANFPVWWCAPRMRMVDPLVICPRAPSAHRPGQKIILHRISLQQQNQTLTSLLNSERCVPNPELAPPPTAKSNPTSSLTRLPRRSLHSPPHIPSLHRSTYYRVLSSGGDS